MKRILKIVTHPIILAVGILAAIIILIRLVTCMGCEQYKIPILAETETVQTAMNAMMADKKITTVTPNDDTTGSPGVNTWTGFPEGPYAVALDGYLINARTKYYFCWDSKGNVYAQNKKDGVKAEPDDAEKQRPCKKAP